MCEDCGEHGDAHQPGATLAAFQDRRTTADDRVQGETGHMVPDGTARLAITGKGGVGKSTFAAAIARQIAAERPVVAVDADPDMNLARTLEVENPPPITAQQSLIEDRVGSDQGLIRLSPAVEDVIETHSTDFGANGRLLTIGAPSGAGSGCMCPENSFIRSLVSTVLSEDFVVMDMEAGVEHLGRGTAKAVDTMIVVVEPSTASIETAERIETLADDLEIESVRAVVNKTRGNEETVRSRLDIPVAATIPYEKSIAEASLDGNSPVTDSPVLRSAAKSVLRTFDRHSETSVNEM